MLNIVVPMAGHGSRFAKAGYTLPKPLLPIHDVPMMQLVIENLRPDIEHRFIFVCQAAHVRDHALDEKLKLWAPGCEIYLVNEVTQGAACTVLLAREAIDNDNPLMIANCDQYIDVDINDYLSNTGDLDGLIMTMQADDPKWSFVSFGEDGYIDNVVEKQVISNDATVGIYNFSRGSDFIKYADRMIERDFRVNGEFYVAPVYTFMIEDTLRIGAYSIGSVEDGMYGLGIPEDLTHFTSLPLSQDVTRSLRVGA
ncbi:glycosyltransferase family 2 protein [Agrobacterium larrymoorei]|uniref:Glycosyl transferase family 2 n=1 Tax=Agrobacterium larrymoorei TaxID=160699 RepID=A0A4D7DP74_9HYPH|nr:glycosyltransferase family 2 protein [Agrobacterium larrymoorei]QCI98905.1 glycosyl transferase family 2 [Agrobacterium larrymoorei]QYA08205.1 glycosyltransferase family 2 protein [Agrobacterium larrymoorei]WHA41009.1 glycosyltransferase family 2 protein [Agrobacterium larrymoorei]